MPSRSARSGSCTSTTPLSLLLFTGALIRLGQEDARHLMQTSHDLDDLWQVGPLPPGDSRMP
jgi:hypothetical protein